MDLVRVLALLSEADRQLLALRYVLGLTSEEIGEQLKASPGAVRTRLSRLLHRLRQELT
jgi:RNA polymerase sigma factor (sigma-70 family)